MKKFLLLFSLAYFAFSANGQTYSIPNGNFETWIPVTYDFPLHYPYTSNYDLLYRYQTSMPSNVIKTTPAYHGSYAVQIKTVASGADTAIGYFINTNPQNGNPDAWTGGIPFDQIPTGITGYYKYNKATGDSATIFVVFSKGGVHLKTYMFNFGGVHSDYVQFNSVFNPPLSEAPDSVIFGVTSSNIMVKQNGVAGSILTIDYVSFTGVVSQPDKMNGDFEAWDSQTSYTPANWYINGESSVISRTTDAKKGDYAVKLVTYLGTDQNNNPEARAGQLATGYYPKNCSNNCNELGGNKYSQMNDVLTFWYKYYPSSDDSAIVFLNFKKNGNSVAWKSRTLHASADYQFVEMPFNLWQAPDTVIVNIQSSYWNDTLVSSVGSYLIIDEIQFKSQPILYAGLPKMVPENNLSIFPNPSDGKFKVRYETGIKQVVVYNLIGKQVYSKDFPDQEKLNEIDLSKFQKGVYFIEVYDGTEIHAKKIVIQ